MALAIKKGEVHSSVWEAIKALFSRHGHHEASITKREPYALQENLVFNSDLLNKQIAWENDQLSDAETLAFFQELVDTGLAWKSTGPVRRTAALLIRDGQIHERLNPSDELRRPDFPAEETKVPAKRSATD